MIIKGEKIILRPIKISDAEKLMEWSLDSEITRFLKSGRSTLKKEKKWIRELKKNKQEIHFAVETKEGVLIGDTELLLGGKSQDKRALFNIVIGDKKYWNKGYGTEAMKLTLEHAFKKLKLHRIELGVTSFNPRAIHIYKKLGFKLEGVRRERVFYKGKFRDSFLMGILQKEWKRMT